MAKGALFVGWGSMIAGREETAQRVLAEGLEVLTQLQESGMIDSFEIVGLEPHGGDLQGFVLLKGDQGAIGKLRMDEAFVRLLIAIQLVHNNVGVTGAFAGAEFQSLMEMWDQQEKRFL